MIKEEGKFKWIEEGEGNPIILLHGLTYIYLHKIGHRYAILPYSNVAQNPDR